MKTTLSRSISDIRLRICEGECCVDTCIGDADVEVEFSYTPGNGFDDSQLRIISAITTKPAILYGDIGGYMIECGKDIKNLLSRDQIEHEEEEICIEYESMLESDSSDDLADYYAIERSFA